MFMSFISAFKAGHWIIFMPLEGGFCFLFFNTMLWICDVAVAKGEERVEMACLDLEYNGVKHECIGISMIQGKL